MDESFSLWIKLYCGILGIYQQVENGWTWGHENHIPNGDFTESKDGSRHAHIQMRTVLRADFLPSVPQERRKVSVHL